ncbi:hypothetical protein K1719_031812 [Acacia pycnantha]|nr:hypothetical protein K1719_031812 [Acacia pycnantha]
MNIKPSSKPIASPGRTDKFPPPLMRFLRTNVASRSRGRSRSSPMFVRKKNTAIDFQEPSSLRSPVWAKSEFDAPPNIITMPPPNGIDTTATQVPPDAAAAAGGSGMVSFAAVLSPKSGQAAPATATATTASQLNLRERYNEETTTRHVDYESEEEGFQERANANSNTFANEDVTAMPTTPPKNALLLTRCRSAPYRSSSLASRFWGSSLNCEETEEGLKTELQNGQQAEHEKASSQMELVSDTEDRLDPRAEEEPEFFKELEDSIKERIIKSENARDLKREDGGGDSARPLILTRCKSEPARTAQKLDPEFNFWKKRRLGLADSCSPHYL